MFKFRKPKRVLKTWQNDKFKRASHYNCLDREVRLGKVDVRDLDDDELLLLSRPCCWSASNMIPPRFEFASSDTMWLVTREITRRREERLGQQ